MNKKIVASLIGYSKLDNLVAGFVLPIFKYEGRYFAQQTNQSGTKVVDFIEIEDARLHLLNDGRVTKVGLGDPSILMFVFAGGGIVYGAVKTLYSEIKKRKEFNSLSGMTLVQLSKVFPDEQEGNALVNLANDIRQHQGEGAYKSYINSAVRSNAWEYIDREHPKLMEKIVDMEELSSIDFHLADNGEVSFVNHSNEIEIPHQQISKIIDHLKQYLKKMEVNFYEVKSENELNEDDLALHFDHFSMVLEIIPRQEERLSFIAIFAILYPLDLIFALKDYHPRAKSEMFLIKKLKAELSKHRAEPHLMDFVLHCVQTSWFSGSRSLFAKYFLFWTSAEPLIWRMVSSSNPIWQLNYFSDTMIKVLSENDIAPVKITQIMHDLEDQKIRRVISALEVSRAVSALNFSRLIYRKPESNKEYLLKSEPRFLKTHRQVSLFDS